MQQSEASLAEFLGGGCDRLRVVHLELHADLRHGAILRPLHRAEARLRGL
jgi:hypothetical protein